MRLLHTGTVQLFSFQHDIPPYAVISHRQFANEGTFQDLWPAPRHNAPGYQVIARCCEFARSQGWNYVWIESCCIDRTNDAETSEALASQYQWHRSAGTCYAYLSDVPGAERDSVDGATKSDWFGYAATLPALLASREVVFINADWTAAGTRTSLRHDIAERTGIRSKHLKGRPIRASVAERMSWAADRSVTRAEDLAYSLMGLFDVQIPVRYGEGGENAFLRLQLQVLKRFDDDSLFAWNDSVQGGSEARCGLLATSPVVFKRCGPVQPSALDTKRPRFVPTERGLWGHPLLIPVNTSNPNGARRYLMPLNCINVAFQKHWDTQPQLAILLEQTGLHTFARVRLVEPVSQLFREPWYHRNAFRSGIRIERPDSLIQRAAPSRPSTSLKSLQWDLDALKAQGFSTTFPPTADSYAACIIARDASPGCPRERFLIALKYLPDTGSIDMRIHEPQTPPPRACEPKMGPPLGANRRDTWRTFRTLASGAWLTVRLVRATGQQGAETYAVKVTYTARAEVGTKTRFAVSRASASALVPVDVQSQSDWGSVTYPVPATHRQKEMLALPAPGDENIVDFSRRRRSREQRDTSSERRKARAKKGLRIAGLIAMSIVMKRVVV